MSTYDDLRALVARAEGESSSVASKLSASQLEAGQLRAELAESEAARDELEAELLKLKAPPREVVVMRDPLAAVPKPLTLWNVDAPAGMLASVGDAALGRAVLETRISHSQPLNPQLRCKTEVGPRDQQKTTESFARLPTDVPVRMSLRCFLPKTWVRCDYKFPLWGFHGDLTGLQRGPFSMGVWGDRVYLWVDSAERGPADLTANGKPGWPRWEGWRKVDVEAVLSEDSQRGRVKFTLEGYPPFEHQGANAVGQPYFKFGMYCPAWSRPERDEKPVTYPAFVQFARWADFSLAHDAP